MTSASRILWDLLPGGPPVPRFTGAVLLKGIAVYGF
jgi:hypothetical protein